MAAIEIARGHEELLADVAEAGGAGRIDGEGEDAVPIGELEALGGHVALEGYRDIRVVSHREDIGAQRGIAGFVEGLAGAEGG